MRYGYIRFAIEAAKALLVGLLVVIFLAVSGQVAAASPPDSPPGQGECQHGNSGQECKPDPQPDNGKDCDEHGPHEGGVNEDHCKGAEGTATPSPTPNPSGQPRPGPTGGPNPVPSGGAKCVEDAPCWDCHTMGNKRCGHPSHLANTSVDLVGIGFAGLTLVLFGATLRKRTRR